MADDLAAPFFEMTRSSWRSCSSLLELVYLQALLPKASLRILSNCPDRALVHCCATYKGVLRLVSCPAESSNPSNLQSEITA
jgi:hypothetical protein